MVIKKKKNRHIPRRVWIPRESEPPFVKFEMYYFFSFIRLIFGFIRMKIVVSSKLNLWWNTLRKKKQTNKHNHTIAIRFVYSNTNKNISFSIKRLHLVCNNSSSRIQYTDYKTFYIRIHRYILVFLQFHTQQTAAYLLYNPVRKAYSE